MSAIITGAASNGAQEKDNKTLAENPKAKIESLIQEISNPKEDVPEINLSPSVEVDDSDFNRILDAIKKRQNMFGILIHNHAFNQKQQENLLLVLSQKEGLFALDINRFDLTASMVQLFLKFPRLRTLNLNGLSKIPSLDTIKLELLAESRTLENLALFYADSTDVVLAWDKINITEGVVLQDIPLPVQKLNMDIKVLLPFITGNRLSKLLLPDYNIASIHMKTLREAIENNTSLICLALPKTCDVTGYNTVLKRNVGIKYPVDRIRIQIKNGKKHMYFAHSFLKEIIKIWNEKSGKELKEKMVQIGFDPNGYYHDEINPIINGWIAEEWHVEAKKLMETFSDELDPNQRDWNEKTALIIAAKSYAADQVFLALLEHLKDKIDFNAQDEDGCTALHYLCAYAKSSLIEALLIAGAEKVNCNIKDNKGRTPIDYASAITADELKLMLESISIFPYRDSNAINDRLWPQMDIEPPTNPNDSAVPIADNSSLDYYNQLIQGDKCPNYTTAASKETWAREYARMKQLFSGNSILGTCQLEREKLLKSDLKAILSGEQKPSTTQGTLILWTLIFDKLKADRAKNNSAAAKKPSTFIKHFQY